MIHDPLVLSLLAVGAYVAVIGLALAGALTLDSIISLNERENTE